MSVAHAREKRAVGLGRSSAWALRPRAGDRGRDQPTVLDEPLGALDTHTCARPIQEELKNFPSSAKLGITFVFVTHAQSEGPVRMRPGGGDERRPRRAESRPPPSSTPGPARPSVARSSASKQDDRGHPARRAAEAASPALDPRFGTLAGLPRIRRGHRPRPGHPAYLVVPSEYVGSTPATPPQGDTETDTVSGKVTALDPVGQLAYLTVHLDTASRSARKLTDPGSTQTHIAPENTVQLRWNPKRASIVTKD